MAAGPVQVKAVDRYRMIVALSLSDLVWFTVLIAILCPSVN